MQERKFVIILSGFYCNEGGKLKSSTGSLSSLASCDTAEHVSSLVLLPSGIHPQAQLRHSSESVPSTQLHMQRLAAATLCLAALDQRDALVAGNHKSESRVNQILAMSCDVSLKVAYGRYSSVCCTSVTQRVLLMSPEYIPPNNSEDSPRISSQRTCFCELSQL
jgi:hypothetical protein